jgi:hypothetical protein
MKRLTLSSGHVVQIDNDDYEKVSRFFWRIRFSYHDLAHRDILVVATVKNKNGHSTNILLPRLIMLNPPKDYAVKFKDGNRLNMQKNNLYLVRYCKLSIKRQRWLKEQARPPR